jgi:DNA (cytosine-5-)-methyltransferase
MPLPPHSIDMILCDLPYGVTKNPEDKTLSFTELWRQYKRVIKENGVIALFGAR